MSKSINEAFDNYIHLYNAAVDSGDVIETLQAGKEILRLADEMCQDPNVSLSLKDYYQRQADEVRKRLKKIEKCGGKKPQTAAIGKGDFSATDWFSAEAPKLTLADVAGLDDVKTEFMVNVFAPITPRYAPIYHRYRNDMGLQILLYGPPGTGKTHIVKCLAGQLGCKIAVVQIKAVMANLVGDGAKIISAIFEQAKRYDKCIIFFDEIDTIAASRDTDESRHTKEQLTTLLTNMDGFTSGTREGQIRIIVAATNRPWALDSAVKRGGRFETQIYVPLPDMSARRKLIAMALGRDSESSSAPEIPLAPDVTVDWLAERLQGYAGADIKAICKQIISRPLRREILAFAETDKEEHDHVTVADCEEVIGKYINPITDEMLLQFDAYKANLSFSEYLARLIRMPSADRADYANRWFESNPQYAGVIKALHEKLVMPSASGNEDMPGNDE